MKEELTIPALLTEAARFAMAESIYDEPSLYGVTDGKAVGTYLEHKFKRHLTGMFIYELGNSALGIDFPDLNVDLKVTSVTQPQSSCPFKSARQKIYGLGYHLLVFVYAKTDDLQQKTSRLEMRHTIFIDKHHTADYQMTRGLIEILNSDGNVEDVVAFLNDRNLPVDEIEAISIAEELLVQPPEQGFLTISNALQWRLQYGRAIQSAGLIAGIDRIR